MQYSLGVINSGKVSVVQALRGEVDAAFLAFPNRNLFTLIFFFLNTGGGKKKDFSILSFAI